MGIKREIHRYGYFYLLNIFYWIAYGLMSGYWVIYLSTIGLSFIQVSLLFILIQIAKLIFEFPTSLFADAYGRKASVALSFFFAGVTFIGIYFAGSNMILLSLLFFFLGFVYTFETGSYDAWYIDYVKRRGDSKKLHHFIDRAASFAALGFFFGPAIGGTIAGFGIKYILITEGVALILLSIYSILGKEFFWRSDKKGLIESMDTYMKTEKEEIAKIIKTPIVLLLLFVAFVFQVGASIVIDSASPVVELIGTPLPWIGYAFSVSGIISFITLNLDDVFCKILKGEVRLLIATAFAAAAMCFMVFISNVPLVSALGLTLMTVFFDLCSPSLAPSFRYIFNKAIPSRIRSTITSILSAVLSGAIILGTFIFGIVSDTFGIKTALLVGTVIFLSSVLVYFRIDKRQHLIYLKAAAAEAEEARLETKV